MHLRRSLIPVVWLLGHRLQNHLRERFGVVVIAVRKAGAARVEEVPPDYVPNRGDRLLVVGTPAALEAMRSG